MSKHNLVDNVLLNVDSYKVSHFGFMEPGTTKIFSYIEARKGGDYPVAKFFGLQYFLKKYFLTPITQEMIDEAEIILLAHGEPFNRAGWQYILDHRQGKLPLRIRSVKEGTCVPEGNVLVTVENTDIKCAWLSSYFETPLLRAAWYGTTVATRSMIFRDSILKALEETGDPSLINFKLIDFGARGVSSKESSEISGMAHLLNFLGTDNIVGILASMQYYNTKTVTGFSIPASEHSVTTAYGEHREAEFISHAIDIYGGEGKLISLVADSYDTKEFIKILGTKLKEKIINNGCTIVVRPDSGDPAEMVLTVIRELEKYFGSTVNAKGFTVLHPAVRVIQGDGINIPMVHSILFNLRIHRYSADNVTFGCGGYLLQQLNRDTLRFAMKASYTEVNDESRDVFKMPKTDPSKASKRGRITLVERDGNFATIQEKDMLSTDKELLNTIYEDGELLIDLNFNDIRQI